MTMREDLMFQLIEHVRKNEHTIVNAMQVYASRMDDNAAEFEEAHLAGESNGLITNNGYKNLAGLGRESADRARTVAHELQDLMDSLAETD